MIKAVDLFCGIGALTHGLINSGIHVGAGIDLDSSCSFAYSHNNINKDNSHSDFILESVSEVDSAVIRDYLKGADYTVLVGCAPCQPFSRHQKDKQNRQCHSKWGLLYDFLEHVRKVKPDIVSMENVSALQHEDVFLDFINTLRDDLGYCVDYWIVNAADYGVPQRRTRLLLLGSKLGKIELIPPTHKNNHFTVRDAIGHLPPIAAGTKNIQNPLHSASSLIDLNITRIQHSVPGGSWKDWPEELLPNCYRKKTGSTYTSVYGRMEWDKVSPTLTTQFGMYGTGRFGHPEQDRALTLLEGAILQSFPETYQFIENNNLKRVAIARQIGNAVPVRLGEIIGLSIKTHIDKNKGGI